MKKKRSYKVLIALGVSILIISLITTTVVLFVRKDPNQNKKILPIKIIKKKLEKRSQDNFFPKRLNEEKIYKLIRIKKGKPFFKNELVSLVINQVIKEGSFINGKLSYWYNFKDHNKILFIAFKWESSSGETQEMTYNIKIKI